MIYPNGRLPKTALTEIQPGAFLALKTARAWRRLAAAAETKLHRHIAAAGGAGAYRSWAVQDAMQKASVGHDAAAKARWNLNPNSSDRLAAAGTCSHGFGTRIDIVGTPIDTAFLALAARYGFKREFGPADPNHFIHDDRTATNPIAAAATRRTTPKPRPARVTVGPDDSLAKIADRNRTTIAELLHLNPTIVDPDLIRRGQRIRIR